MSRPGLLNACRNSAHRLARPCARAAIAAGAVAIAAGAIPTDALAANASPPPMKVTVRNAALQVMAGDDTTDAEAVRVEARLWKAFAPVLEKRGFRLLPLGPLHEHLAAQGIPEAERHAPSSSPANTALIVRLRELDVELHWMTVLSRDGDKVRLALSALGYHDLSSLGTDLRQAPSLDGLEALLDQDAAKLVDAALAKFKPAPMPAWWRPQAFSQPAPAAAQVVAPAPQGPRLPDGARLAVLDLHRSAGFTVEDARYLADVVRAAALKAAPRLSVMTRENLLVLLQASGKELADCEGECEVDTGRRIGADAVVSGEVLRFGARYKLSLRLHETKDGRLLAAGVASGTTLEELDAEVQTRAAELLAGQR